MDYFDTFTKHIIDTEFYAQEREDYLKSRLETLTRRIKGLLLSYDVIRSKKTANEARAEVKKEIHDFIADVKAEEEEEIKEQVNEESDYLKTLIETVFGILLAKKIIDSKIVDVTSAGNKNVYDFFDWLEKSVDDSAKTVITGSYTFGQSTSDFNDKFDADAERIIRGAGTELHTLTSGVQRNTEKLLFLGTNKFRFQYIAMLDRSTCLSCSSLSGKIYNSLAEAEELPLHRNCRCYYIPITDEPIEEQSYEEWFNEQSASTQYSILGKTRYNLYKKGMKISSFTSEGRLLTLNELYEKNDLLKK